MKNVKFNNNTINNTHNYTHFKSCSKAIASESRILQTLKWKDFKLLRWLYLEKTS